MTLEGKQLGRYQVVRLLGSGGMGEVYLAEDPRIGQQVALKVIRSELTPYPNAQSAQEAARLFQREARAIVKLDHPHILPLNDYGEAQLGEQTLIYLVMPYRPEGSLVAWIRQRFPDQLVPPALVAHILRQAAQAIQHAHDHQIIHQDVKPSNFLLRERAEDPDHPDVLLADFGIAHLVTSTASASQNLRGTPTYMSPEQCMGKPVMASDQYALAVMAYELLTGRPPFQGNAVHLMFQHIQVPPEPPSTYHPHLTKEVDYVLLTALSKRPEERFRSVAAFATAFNTAVQALEQAEAATQVSNATLPKITTGALPAIMPSDDALADASTYITPQVTESTQNPPTQPSPPPVPPSWAMTATAPTTPPLPEANDLEEQQERGMLTPTMLQKWTDEAGAPNGDAEAQPSEPVAAPMPTPSVPGITSGPRRSRKRRFLLIVAAVLVVLALAFGGIASAVPGLLVPLPRTASSPPAAVSSATVTITPASKHLSSTYTLSAVIGTPDASKQQVGAYLLSATTPAYSKTVNATGQGTIPGTQATGQLTIHNLGTSFEDFNPGMVLAQTNRADGTDPCNPDTRPMNIHMVLDGPAPVAPGSSMPVPAHVLEVGTVGNIPPVVNNCVTFQNYGPFGAGCPSTGCWEISNLTPFTGGQDPQTYTTVAQSDINNAASALESADRPNPQQVLQPQIKPNEQLVGTPQCTPHASANHKAGDQATTVTVSVTFTCTGEVYDHDGALALAATLLMQQAAMDPGAGYALVGTINTAITNVAADSQGTITLTMSAEGTWAYQFTHAHQQALARLIAGKSKAQAQQLLAAQPGVASATIHISGTGQKLPSDPSKITIVIQAVERLPGYAPDLNQGEGI